MKRRICGAVLLLVLLCAMTLPAAAAGTSLRLEGPETLPAEEIRKDMKKIADELAPCDFVLADLETTMSDERVREILDEAQRLSGELENRMEEKG